MNTEQLCFGQRYDSELGILEPWYTNPAMDRIKQMDLSDKIIMEWGSGASTKWWCKQKTKLVFSVDHNKEWFDKAMSEISEMNGKLLVGYVDTFEGDQSEKRNQYVSFANLDSIFYPKGDERPKINIAIVDGIHRYECAEYAVKVLKPEILIIDNHQQDYVFMCPKLDELLEGVKMERFIQPDHTDHSGNPWATAIFYLNEKA